MIKRTVSLLLSLALLANGIQPIYAADLVAIPQSVHLPTPPSSIQTRSSELSFKSIETKINNVLKPEKTQLKIAATSGACGTNVKWNLDTSTGKLTISGSGTMTDQSGCYTVPWYSYRSSIKTVVIENGVTSIGSYAFSGCTRLTSVSIPDSVTYIGNYAFDGCTGLTSVTIPASVTSIGLGAFIGCTGLTSVTIPDSVTYIGFYAFEQCTGLTSVTYRGTTDPNHGKDIFRTTPVTKVTVPCKYTTSTFCGKAIEKICTTMREVHLVKPYSFLRHLLNLFLLGKE